jgi:hypothetical protein
MSEVRFIEDGTNDLIGYIKEPFFCFDIVFSIHNKKGDQEFLIDGPCFQCSLWCNLCGGSQTSFFVTTPDLRVLSKMIKTKPKTEHKYRSDDENETLVFPLDCTDEELALLVATAVLIDFKYFDDNV